MHEYSIVDALIRQVGAAAAGHGEVEVRRLEVRIGELSGVETELLMTAFETFRERTICARARLEITPVAARWECPACGRTIAAGAPLRCTECVRPARLVEGDEIILDRIEMEVPDV